MEEHFQKEAKGEDAINHFQTDDFDNKEHDEELERILEEDTADQDYKKELLARMFGGTLTARQYAVLFNMEQDEILKEKNQRQDSFEAENWSKDGIRVAEEKIESMRRRKVMNGEWPEDQSHRLMQQELDKLNEQYPSETSYNISMREEALGIHKMMELRNSTQILEREYYFDEGLGESLNEHVETLKKNF